MGRVYGPPLGIALTQVNRRRRPPRRASRWAGGSGRASTRAYIREPVAFPWTRFPARAAGYSNGTCSGSIVPSPRMTFLNSGRLTET